MIAKELCSGAVLPNRFGKTDAVWINAITAPLKTYGVFYSKSAGKYLRINSKVAEQFDDVFLNLNARTSGGRLRFKTNSPYIGLFVKQTNFIQLNNMTLCAHSGFDIYADNRYAGTYMPKTNIKNGFSDIIETDGECHEYTLNFPLFDNVEELFICLSADCEVTAAAPYINEERPIIFYGSSITQGACASRPGLSYPAAVCRRLNADFVNLGFSARCLGEREMAEYIRDLPKSAVVIDFDHNAPDSNLLKERHFAFYKTVRGEDKNLPIIIASAPDIAYKPRFEERREVIINTYNKAKQNDDNVYFADGKTLLGNNPYDCTVDNLHPNDLGLYNIANVFYNILKNNAITGD